MPTPLKKLNEVIAGLIKAQSFYASMGAATDDTVWASAAAKILNGNALKIVPGPAATQITVSASAMCMTVPLAGFIKIEAASDVSITSSVPVPPGARTDGTNYFFSQFTTWNETPVLMAAKYSHVYVVYDTTKTNNLAIGVIATPTIAEPTALLSYLGITVSERQAVCYVNSSGNVTMLQTFPAIFGTTASVSADAAPSFADWAGVMTADSNNAITVQFTFPEGVGTGSVGQLAVKVGADIVGFLAISPQLLKDSDVPLVLNWTLMVGEPGAFL